MARVRERPEHRAEPRYVPMSSVAAAILDGDSVIYGVVTNLSESGASLVTGEPIHQEATVKLQLSRFLNGLLETEARVIWHANGTDAAKKRVGSRLGLSFTGLSPHERSKIREFLLSPGFDLAPSRREDVPAHPANFDLLIDPDIERLFSDEDIDVETALRAIRSQLEPFLRRLSAGGWARARRRASY